MSDVNIVLIKGNKMKEEKKKCFCWACRRTSYADKSKTLNQKIIPILQDGKFRANYRPIPKVLAKEFHKLFN